jgi:hypothetical protein
MHILRWLTPPEIAHRTVLTATCIRNYVKRYPETLGKYVKGQGRDLLIREDGIPVLIEIRKTPVTKRREYK